MSCYRVIIRPQANVMVMTGSQPGKIDEAIFNCYSIMESQDFEKGYGLWTISTTHCPGLRSENVLLTGSRK